MPILQDSCTILTKNTNVARFWQKIHMLQESDRKSISCKNLARSVCIYVQPAGLLQAMVKIHGEFMDSLEEAKTALDELQQLDDDINQPHKHNNPYTWFTMDAINETWNNLLQRVSELGAQN